MGVGFLVIAKGVVFLGVTMDCFGAGSSGLFESKAKNSSQLSSTTPISLLVREWRGYLNFPEIERGQSLQ